MRAEKLLVSQHLGRLATRRAIRLVETPVAPYNEGFFGLASSVKFV
jgi:hypothetical protein